jgi:SAM-dependent methyltransferase
MKNSEIYSYIYKHALPNGRGLYGAVGRRDSIFMQFIREHCPSEDRILDASCGRGTLLKWLLAEGYKVRGTELAAWLFSPDGDLYGKPVDKLSYAQLCTIPSNSYDVVISNDVLEHLDSEESVYHALHNLATISKKWLLVSTGGHKACTCQFPELGVKHLHVVVNPEIWWRNAVSLVCNIEFEELSCGSYFLFGRIK